MKKRYLTYGKKTLSLMLTVLMLMSCWVFVPGEHNKAVAADDESATAAINKNLLSSYINVNVDSIANVSTTYGTFHFAGNGDQATAYNKDNRTTKSFQNVLYSPDDTSSQGPGVTFSGVGNADNVRVWYPTTVLKYDGGTAKMGILLEADASKGNSLRCVSCWIDSGAQDFRFASTTDTTTAWKGTATDDSCFYYVMYESGDGLCFTSDGQATSTRWGTGKGVWTFFANHLVFSGSMGNDEWVRTVKPTWKFRGGSNDDSIYTATATNPIYLMNIKAYKDLANQIKTKAVEINNNAGLYTTASVQTFVNAASEILNTLKPSNYVSTSSQNVSNWASRMASAKTNYTNAVNGLQYRTFDVTFENIFSISDWRHSESNNATVENDTTISLYKSGAGSERTTISSYPNNHLATRYAMPIEGGKDYVISYNIADNSTGDGILRSEVFMFWYDANNNPVNNVAGSATFNNQGFNDKGTHTVTFTAPANAAKAEIRFDNDSPNSETTLKFNKIAVYPKEREDAHSISQWGNRPDTAVYAYNTALNTKSYAVPTRVTHAFNGWYNDTNPNGVKDSGEEIANASGAVTSTAKVTKNINLYADWTYKTLDIGYDNLFSLAKWSMTNSAKASGSGEGTVSYDVDNGTITVNCTAGGEKYTTYGSGADQYKFAVEPGKEYIFKTTMNVTGSAEGYSGQMFVFFYNANGNGLSGAIYNGSAQSASHIGIYPGSGTWDIRFTTPADCTQIAFRVGATKAGTTATYSDIGFYKAADYDAYVKNYSKIREPFTVSKTLNLDLNPGREGYVFDGWFTADGNKITSTAGLTESTTVFAHWTKMFTVKFYNGDVLCSTVQVAPGGTATKPIDPAKAPDENYEYTFTGWDTEITNVQSDLTVKAVFAQKGHTDITIVPQTPADCMTPGTYKKYCVCGYNWNDAIMSDTNNEYGFGATGHNCNIPLNDGNADTHILMCSNFNCTYGENGEAFTTREGHKWVQGRTEGANCVTEGTIHWTCSVCSATKTTLGATAPDVHAHTEIRDAVDAKCEVPGYTGDTWCTDCNTKIKTGTATEALKHVYTKYVYNEGTATCFADGTETAVCDLCSVETDTRTAVGSKLTHEFTNYTSDGNATCTADGTKTAYCNHGCGTTNTVTDEGSKLAHDFDETKFISKEDGTHVFECKDCGAESTPVACTYGAWDNTNSASHSHTCTACGYTPAAEIHSWKAWETVGGTASSEATQKRVCSVCMREETSACNYVVIDHKDATCEAPEITTKKCSDCGHKFTVIGDPAKTHNFTKEKGVQSDNRGNHRFLCANGCGEYGYNGIKGSYTPCSDWDYNNSEAGKHTATCKDCGYVKTENCKSTGENIATCTKAAVCDLCNTEYGTTVPHSFKGASVKLEGDFHAYLCEFCGEDTNIYGVGTTEKATEKCSGGTATCSALAECTVCGDTYGELDEDAHKWGAWVNVNGTETHTRTCEYDNTHTETADCYSPSVSIISPDCESQGYTINTCEFCAHEWYTGYTEPLGHDWDAWVNNEDGTHTRVCKDPTCKYGENGAAKTETASCTKENATAVVTKPDCYNGGYTTYTCKDCGREWIDDVTAPLDHIYTKKVFNAEHLKEAANCEHEKIYWYACSLCNKNAKTETNTDKYTALTYLEGNKREHSWVEVADEDYLASYATCTASAKYYKSCEYEDCKKSSLEVEGEVTTKKFSFGPALGHDWIKPDVTDPAIEAQFRATDADCITDATYYYTCSRADDCGMISSKDSNKEEKTWTLVGSAKNHDFDHADGYKAKTEADCYNAGNYEYWHCEVCNKYFKDAAATEAYLAASETVIKKREHKIETVSSKMPTCEEDGHPAYTYCKYEDCNYTTLPSDLTGYEKKGHNFTGAWYCDTVHNYHSKLCLNGCGASGLVIDDQQVKYTVEYDGLDFVISGGIACDFTGAFVPTTDENGKHGHEVACVCGNVTSVSYSDEDTFVKTVAPDCENDGYDLYKCPDCDAEWQKNIVATAGHDWAKAPTSNGDGTHSTKCSKCDEEKNIEKCSGGTATCSEQAVCEICNTAYGKKGDHVIDETKWVYQNDALCGVNGTEKNSCTVCQEEVVREALGTALEHDMSAYGFTTEGWTGKPADFDESIIKRPGCKEEGLSISFCQRKGCSHYLTALVEADENLHVWATNDQWIADEETGEKVWETVGGNCADGITLRKTCALCGTRETTTIDGEHNFVQTIYIEPTCTKAGYKQEKCTICQFVNEITYDIADESTHFLAPLGDAGHEYGPYVSYAATCTSDAYSKAVCIHCKGEDVIVETGSMLPHNNKTMSGKAASCDTDGYTEYSLCLDCGLETGRAVIPATGHKDDGEGRCDECNKVLYETEDGESKGCGCICHKTNFFSRFIYKIINFFWKLFKISKSCNCGTVVHW